MNDVVDAGQRSPGDVEAGTNDADTGDRRVGALERTNFQRPQRITADPPPQPYVDMRRESIVRRVLVKEVLRQAFAALNLFPDGGGESVHGEFGKAAA